VWLQLLLAANVVPSSLIFHPDDGSDTFLRNVGSYKSHTVSHPRRRYSSIIRWFVPGSSDFNANFSFKRNNAVLRNCHAHSTFSEWMNDFD
jgi:hypothetical protein